MSTSSADGSSLSPQTLESATSVRWRIVGLLMAISFLNHFNRISMAVTGNGLIEDRFFSEIQMGVVYSALLYAYTLCMTPGGWFSDVFGGRIALTVVGFGSGLCAVLTGLTLRGTIGSTGLVGSAWGILLPLVLIRGLMGVCIAPIYPGSGAVISRWIPFRQRAWAMALITGAAPLGIAYTFPVFGWLIEEFGRSRAFVIVGAVTSIVALIWVWYSRNDPSQHSGVSVTEKVRLLDLGAPAHLTAAQHVRKEQNWSALLRNRSLWLITLSYGTLGYMEYLQFYWSDYYFANVLKFKGDAAVFAPLAPPLLMAVCMPLGGWLSDRLMPVLGYRGSRAGVAGFGMVGSAAALCLATFLKSPPAIVAGFAVSLGLIGLSEGPSWATAIDLGRQRGGTSAGIFNTGGNGIGALAPFVTPWFKSWLVNSWKLGDTAAWGWSLRLGSAICLAGAVLWLWIDPAEQVEQT